MLSYSKYLFCFLAISVVDSIVIDPFNYLQDLEQYYQYQKENGEKVDVKLYYEALCGGCKTFHRTLDDVYKKIGSYIDLHTYPYGGAQKVEEKGKIIIICQHGPAECYGNKLHACAIDVLKDVSKSEFYNTCMMNGTWGGKGSTDQDATNCGQAMGIDAKPIIDCAKSQRGEDLLEYYGKETEKLTNVKYIPWILINGKPFDPTHDFMAAVCEKLTNPPTPCKEYLIQHNK